MLKVRLASINGRITRMTFQHLLLKRAYRPQDMQAMAEQSRFNNCELHLEGIGFEALLRKLP